jgi:DNA-binding CsgD family transcriptional regulator
LSGLAPLLALEGRLDEALSALEEGRAAGPEVRDSVLVDFATIVHWLGGRFPDALETAREAVGANLIGKRRAFGLLFGALSAAEMGQVQESRRYLAMAWDAYREGEWVFGDYCRYTEAMLGWREHDRIDSLEDLRNSCLRIVRWGKSAFAVFPLLDLVEAAAESGAADVAREGCAHLAQLATLLDRGVYRGLHALGEALADLTEGRWDRATDAGRSASQLLSPAGFRAFQGRALDAVGRALCTSDRAGAIAAFQHAAALFERCGVTWRRNRTLKSMEALGQRGRRLAATVGGPRPLTAREREIASIACRGLTSREIAEQLFLSERTVEAHLAHVYGKLGVRSKTELARRAAELNL